MYNTNSDIRFKTTMLKSSLCDYSDAYLVVVVEGTVKITGAGNIVTARQEYQRNKAVIFKNCTTFISCKKEIIQK